MNCTKCGQDISEGMKVCPACGTEVNDQTKQKFALELKEKIKKMIREENNFNEANNYIDLYFSMIGMDAEIIEFQEEIMKMTRLEKEQTEIPSATSSDTQLQADTSEPKAEKGGFPELEIEINKVPEQSSEPPADQQPPGDDEILFPESKGDLLNLEDEISFEDISDLKIEETQPDRQGEPQAEEDLELSDESDDELLVLEADDEILELEEDMREPQTEKKDAPENKDIMSQIENEIDRESKEQEKALATPDTRLSGFDQDILAIPDDSLSPGVGKSPDAPIAITVNGLNTSEPVESILNDLKERKKKFKRWLFIFLAIIAFIALIITLYYLSTRKGDNHQITDTPLTTRQAFRKSPATQEIKTDQNQSMQEKSYLDILARAKGYLEKGDIQNTEKMIARAKKIKTSDTLTGLELEVKKKKAEQDVFKNIEVRKNPEQTSDSEERAYNRALSSSSPILYQEYLKNYPYGKYAIEIRKKIKELEKKNRENFDQQFFQKVKLHQKIQCRDYFQNLSDKEIEILKSKKNQISQKVEIQTIDGNKVIISFSTGLMWHQWKETMDFKKAKWWARRGHAGYFDWRLPTAEEAATLSIKDIQNLLPGNISNYEIWTGDTDIKDSLKAWVYSLSRSTFKSVLGHQHKNIWSVRMIKGTKKKRF